MDLRSGMPYWLIANGLLRTYPALDGDATCEVAILGGGITGAMLAHRLTSAGVDVVVVDKRDIGQGSTCASTNLLLYETDAELAELAERFGEAAAARSHRLGLEAIDHIEALAESSAIDCRFARRPSLYLASRRSHVRRLESECALRRKLGFDAEWWSAGALREHTGFEAHGAIWSQGDAEIDAFRLTHSLFDRARSAGAQVYDRTEVTLVETLAGGMRLETARGNIHAKRLAFATGYESNRYLPRPIGRLKSTYALATEPCSPLPNWRERCLVWESSRPYMYLRATHDERIVIGGEDTHFANDHRRDRLLAKKTARLEKRLQAMFRDRRFETAYAWAGTFGESDDGLPYIGEHAEAPNCYFALGYGGNGITFSALAARLIADLYLRRPNADLELFSFARADRSARGSAAAHGRAAALTQ